MLKILEVVVLLVAIPVAVGCAYLALLALLGRGKFKRPAQQTSVLFDIIVPAHDEEEGIGATVDSLSRLDYPPARRRIIVVADNCSDDTALIAKRHGAEVWERRNPEQRGKGYALAWAFERSLEEGVAEAVVVIDADTLASPNLLSSFAGRLQSGAQALQADYGVRNRDDSWRTVLMRLALALFHEVRSLGRERLGLSCGLRGNGMCFETGLLSRVPHTATSSVEDIEYGLILGEKGVRVHYVPEAQVQGDMPVTDQASRVQRARWEGGRQLLARRWAPRLLLGAVRERSRVMLDLAVDLLLPPLSTLGGWVAAGLSASVILSLVRGALGPSFFLFAFAALCLLVHLGRGLVVSKLGWRGFQVFLWAPVYLLWRIVKVSGQRKEGARQWVRTPRQRGVG